MTQHRELRTVHVTLNDEPSEVPAHTSVAELVRSRQGVEATTGFAVAVGESVLPRAEWPNRLLAEGDSVEIVTAVQGG